MNAQVLFRLKQYAAASPELLPGTIIRDIHFDIKEAIAEIERLGSQVEEKQKTIEHCANIALAIYSGRGMKKRSPRRSSL
jgi:hypothetical protein